MLRRKLAALLVTAAILAATFGALLFYFFIQPHSAPSAEGGMLDLTDWRFEEQGVVALDGEWEFYPNELLDPEDVAAGRGTPHWIRVPGNWNGQMDHLGTATYRLRINIADGSPTYGLKTSSIQIANRVYINGQEVGSAGVPADGEAAYEALNWPYVCYFPLHAGWNELIVQVANFELLAGGGINESIYLGDAEHITKLRTTAMSHDWIVFTAFLIMGLYFIGLYTQRKGDFFLIVFGVICVLTAFYSSTRGDRVLFSLFGPVPFWLYLRIQIASAIGAGMGFLLYVYTAFRPYCSPWLVRIGLIFGALLTVATLGFIIQLNTELFRMIITFYATFPLLYAVYVFVLAAFHKVEGSLYLIIAAVALNAHAIVQNSNVYFGVPVYKVMPFEPFLFLLMLSLLMSLRFSNAFYKIEELSVQLLRADKLKDEFLARTSHEFKSPLHGVINIARSMLEDRAQPLSGEQRERLSLISSIAGRLSQLVYDVLDLSKLKQGELVVQPTPIDVRTAVDVNLRIYSYLSADRNIRLENRVPEQLPYALADESRFSQIVGNLLDNAIKHTENGSIIVSAEVRGDKIEISVQDTGEGIEEQALPSIFEPFQSMNTSMVHRGVGLGLPIVKQLVELQDGEMAVTTVKGEGTTFTFTLPAAADGRNPKAHHPDFDPDIKKPDYSFATPYVMNQKGDHTILLVDDNFSNLKILIDALQPLSYNLIAVKNGREALAQIDPPHEIDLVVLDLMMPGMSGYEVCQQIRKKHTMLELPVLMVTAAIQPDDKVAAFEAGANDFLTKPFDLSELKARIQSLLVMKESFGKAVDLEVAFLQSQIKPHFLFNVLNTIVATSYTNVEETRKLTADLADYLRGSFQFSNVAKRVPFLEELHLIRTFVEIEQARFKERIQVEFDIEESMYDIEIPPLLLQPLVENAIRHGIGERPEGGKVKISAVKEQHQYCFVIEDDGVGIESGRLGELLDTSRNGRNGVGMLNINKRLKFEYGTELEVKSELDKGTKVTVRIPAAAEEK